MELTTLFKKDLIKDIKELIDQSKSRVVKMLNSEMIMLYWHIGKRINQDILQDKRAQYGMEVVRSLAGGGGA